ncbi:Solute carrier family 28 member 3 [Holothuria leucospilota]|uniref:Sodium/nucleoside cotransporter n=1 Tax=Holothuria leucospilota TaxID=206669 RepID=A0A9Q1H4Q5_HOLLE|nr:Solute carrier family 28 member 3 [Holothuria leucospilota]
MNVGYSPVTYNPSCEHEDEFNKMQDFTNPAGPEDTKEPLPNGGPQADDVPPSTPLNHTSIQMDDVDKSPDDEKKDLDEPDDFQAKCWKQIDNVTADWIELAKDNEALLKRIFWGILLVLYLAYLIHISVRDVQEASIMLVLTALAVIVFVYVTIRDYHGDTIWAKFCKPSLNFVQIVWKYGKWIFFLICLAGIAVGLYLLTKGNPEQLISAGGLLVFILFTYIFSKHPRHVKWRPVVWGLVLQFILGIFILRTDIGFNIFQWLGDVTRDFLDFSDAGAKFVFGADTYTAHFFAFKVLPVVIYFSAVISVFYHLGIMQIVITKIAWLMQNTMKTTASESLNAAGNIFIGQTEAPLLIRPLIKDMTKSELHAVMTGGFATIAGSVLGAYISFGISPSHLLSASVMSAPAALAISKLFYPETKKSSTKTVDQIELPKSEHRNIIEAASYGAYTAVPLALNIAGNLIAFLALLAFLNGLLGYLGGLAGVPELSFEWICSYVFMPVAFLMGVDPQDCREVARLVGIKTFVNEFFAYEELSTLISNRVNGLEPSLSVRSEVVTTYALCGFSNFGAVGVQLGGISSLAPEKRQDLGELALRALTAGCIACFMTACVAGVLYDENAYDAGMGFMNNATSS